jgi:hypothetical protein
VPVLVQDAHEGVFTVAPVLMGETGTTEIAVRNTGGARVRIASISRDEGSTELTLSGALDLGVGEAGALLVTFSPTQAADVTKLRVTHTTHFTVKFEGTAPDADTLTLTVNGDALAGDCYLPASIDFGRVPPSHAVISTVAVQQGVLAVSETRWSLESQAFAVLDDGAEFSVRFAPGDAGTYAETLSLTRGPECPTAAVKLLGIGDDSAFSWSPSGLDFGRVPLGDVSAREVVINNPTSVDLDLSLSVTSVNFTIEDGAPAVLPGNSSARVFVSCRPGALGPADGALAVKIGTEPQYVAMVPLRCLGGGPRIAISPAPLDFGAVPIGITTRRRVLVRNVGTLPSAPGDTAHNLVLGSEGALPWFSVESKNAATREDEFHVRVAGVYDAIAGVSARAGENIIELEVDLTPMSGERREAQLLVFSNDSVQPVTRVPMSALPQPAEPCTLVTDVDAISFGPTPRGTVVMRDVRLTNAGEACLISGIELAPGSDLAFDVSAPTGGSLLIPGGETRVITVRSTVSNQLDFGAVLNGALRFSVGNEGTPRSLPVVLEVSHCLLVSPLIVDVGVVQEQCTSAPRALTLRNLCESSIEVELPGAPPPFEFAPTGGELIVLNSGERVTIDVEIVASVSGAWNEPVTFRSVEAGEDVLQNVTLHALITPDGIQRDSFTTAVAAVDILFVVDDSCSMGDEQMALANNFASFISAATSGLGDWHLGVTTTDLRGQHGHLTGSPPVLTPLTPNVAAAFAANVQVGIRGSTLEEPLACMAAALSSTNLATFNAGFLRTDAALAVVIITDAVESSPLPIDAYVASLVELKAGKPELFTVSVIGPFSQTPGCSIEGVDDGRYLDMVTATGGAHAEICDIGSGNTLQGISNTVFSNRRAFTLSNIARSQADIFVTVAGSLVTTGWRLDPETNSVVFDAPPVPGQTFTIDYRTACF